MKRNPKVVRVVDSPRTFVTRLALDGEGEPAFAFVCDDATRELIARVVRAGKAESMVDLARQVVGPSATDGTISSNLRIAASALRMSQSMYLRLAISNVYANEFGFDRRKSIDHNGPPLQWTADVQRAYRTAHKTTARRMYTAAERLGLTGDWVRDKVLETARAVAEREAKALVKLQNVVR